MVFSSLRFSHTAYRNIAPVEGLLEIRVSTELHNNLLSLFY